MRHLSLFSKFNHFANNKIAYDFGKENVKIKIELMRERLDFYNSRKSK
jgi:hypothetical protein